jgi:hypothetical protein
MCCPYKPGGHFLTIEEIAAQKAAAPEAKVARDNDDKHDDREDFPYDMAVNSDLSPISPIYLTP